MSNIDVDYVSRTVHFKVTVEMEYVVDTIPGDPHDDELLADQEKGYLFDAIRDIPGIETDNLKLRISPLEA